MDLSSFDFLPLGEDTEILPFDCNDVDLNNFLFDDAKNYLRDLMAVTYLFVDRQAEKTVAYFSLLNDKVSYDPEECSLWNRINRRISNNKRRKTYPSVKIGRLAVSKDYDNKGVGRAILDFIKHAFTNGNRTGCRFITVDAYATSSRSRMPRLRRNKLISFFGGRGVPAHIFPLPRKPMPQTPGNATQHLHISTDRHART